MAAGQIYFGCIITRNPILVTRFAPNMLGKIDLKSAFEIRKRNCIKDGVYIDDGFSGTNFERPAMKQLLDEIKIRKINCIVVKDLSKLKNYLRRSRMD